MTSRLASAILWRPRATLVRLCTTKAGALDALLDTAFELLLLDITLPDGSGYDVLRAARAHSRVPVIFLTARSDEANVVMGLDMGADDYITKPFRVRELLSRIASVMRRNTQSASGELVYGPLRIRPAKAQVLVAGQDVPFTTQEYRLLPCLAAHPGQLFGRSQLLESLWDVDGSFVNDNTLSVTVKRLRDKLAGAAPAVEVETVRGLGYRLKVEG